MIRSVTGSGNTLAVDHRTPLQKLLDAIQAKGITPESESTNAQGQPQYAFCCPGHEDRQASLAISQGADGRGLIHCHAGCTRDEQSTAELLKNLGLTEADLFPPKHRTGRNRDRSKSSRRTDSHPNGRPPQAVPVAADEGSQEVPASTSEANGKKLPTDVILAATERDGCQPHPLPDVEGLTRHIGFCCPNHPGADPKPRARVKELPGGLFVLECEANCHPAKIAHGLGLTISELMAMLPQAKKSKDGFNTAEEAAVFMGNKIRSEQPQPDYLFPFLHADGQPCFCVARWDLVDSEGKPHKETRPVRINARGKWECHYPDVRPLMNLPELAAADPGSRVFVLEGEKKTRLACNELWLLATCPAGGANQAGKSDWSPLARFAEVAILPDNDSAGEGFAVDVARLIFGVNPAAKIRIVHLPDLPPKGDIVEWLEAHPPADGQQRTAAEVNAIWDELMALADATVPLKPEDLPADVGKGEGSRKKPKPETVFVEEEDNDPRALAKKILPQWDSGPLLRRWRERWYRYDHDSGFYREQSEESLTVMVVRQVDAEFQRLAKEGATVSEDGVSKKLKVSNKLVGDVKTALMSLDGVLLDADQSAPFWIGDADGRPDAGMMATFPNGRLNLADPNSRLEDNGPELFVTGAAGFDFDTTATCPQWLRFLAETFEGDQPSIDALHEFVGLCMTNVTRYHKALLLMGPPRSGKGIILRILEELVGSQQTCSVSLTGLAERFGLEPLIGKKLAVIGDAVTAGKDAKRPIEVLLGTIGEDLQTAEQKHRSATRSFRLAARWAIATNELPRLPNASGAIAARLLILKTGPSKAGQEDFGLRDRLLGELPGIVLEAVRGWHRLQARGGFVHPERGTEELEELRRDSSPVRAFIEDCCEFDTNERINCDALYLWFRKWAETNGIVLSAWSEQRFGRELNAAYGDRLEKIRPRVGSDRHRAYAGIRVITSCF